MQSGSWWHRDTGKARRITQGTTILCDRTSIVDTPAGCTPLPLAAGSPDESLLFAVGLHSIPGEMRNGSTTAMTETDASVHHSLNDQDMALANRRHGKPHDRNRTTPTARSMLQHVCIKMSMQLPYPSIGHDQRHESRRGCRQVGLGTMRSKVGNRNMVSCPMPTRACTRCIHGEALMWRRCDC